jgi:uncharacterized protein with PQ loop repeat
MTSADILVVVATGLAWWSLIPQVMKLLRTRDASGVSSAWPAVGLVSNAGWTAYLVLQGLWAAAPSAAVMTGFYGLLIWALGRTGRARSRGLALGVIWAAVLAAASLLGGVPALGIALASSYVIQFTPPVLAAFREARPTGVSPGTWGLIVVESALWGAYGFANGDRPIMLYAAAGVIGGGAILFRYLSAAAAPTGARGSEITK